MRKCGYCGDMDRFGDFPHPCYDQCRRCWDLDQARFEKVFWKRVAIGTLVGAVLLVLGFGC